MIIDSIPLHDVYFTRCPWVIHLLADKDIREIE